MTLNTVRTVAFLLCVGVLPQASGLTGREGAVKIVSLNFRLAEVTIKAFADGEPLFSFVARDGTHAEDLTLTELWAYNRDVGELVKTAVSDAGQLRLDASAP